MTEHPHAAVLRAIADGVPQSEFEVHRTSWREVDWLPLEQYSLWIMCPDDWKIRRKQKFIQVNGFDVPEPFREALEEMQKYFIPSLTEQDCFCRMKWDGGHMDHRWLSRGLVHLTREAAIAHAKAMLGIDPNGEQS